LQSIYQGRTHEGVWVQTTGATRRMAAL